MFAAIGMALLVYGGGIALSIRLGSWFAGRPSGS
jgi:hypothetical protein